MIHRIAVPVPGDYPPVNAYLLEDDPLTLVDPGPVAEGTLDVLEAGVRAAGRRLEDVGLIVLTHQHGDHVGLAGAVCARSGAQVAAWHELVGYLDDFDRASAGEAAYEQAVLRRHGAPPAACAAAGELSRRVRAWGSGVRVTRPLHHGARLPLRRRHLQVLFGPGHSPSDIQLWDPVARVLIGGDHLLPDVPAVPLASLPLRGVRRRRPRLLPAHARSQRRTRHLPADVVLPGHGEPIADHRALIDRRLSRLTREAGRVDDLLAAGPATAYELTRTVWGDRADGSEAFVLLCATLGQLDLLAAARRVVQPAAGCWARA